MLEDECLQSTLLGNRHSVRNAATQVYSDGQQATCVVVLVLLSELDWFFSATKRAPFSNSDFGFYSRLRPAPTGADETAMWTDFSSMGHFGSLLEERGKCRVAFGSFFMKMQELANTTQER